MLDVKVKALCDEAEWMEQCYCHPRPISEDHARLLGQGNRRGSKANIECPVPREAGRIVELTMGRPEKAKRLILGASSAKLTELLTDCGEDLRADIIDADSVFSTIVAEECVCGGQSSLTSTSSRQS